MSNFRTYLTKSITVIMLVAMIVTSMNLSVMADDSLEDLISITMVGAGTETLICDGAEYSYYLDAEGRVVSEDKDVVDEQIDADGNLLDAEGNMISALITENETIIDEEGNAVDCGKVFFVDADGMPVDGKVYYADANGNVLGAVIGYSVDAEGNVVEAVEEDAEETEAATETAAAAAPVTSEPEEAEVLEVPEEDQAEETAPDTTEDPAPAIEEDDFIVVEDEEIENVNAAFVPKWKTIGGYKYYYYEADKFYKNTIATISGKKYAFDADGHLYIDVFFTFKNKKYASDANGVVCAGVFKAHNGNYYYSNPKSCVLVDKAGFVEWKSQKYYVKSNGKLACNDDFKVDGKKYIAGTTCYLRSGVFKFGSRYYYADPDTCIIKTAKGWIKYNGNKYYSKTDGSLYRKKFLDIDGHRYYFNSKAKLVKKGVFTAHDGKLYFAIPENSHIKVKKAIVTYNGKRYFVTNGGAIKSNKKFSDGGYTYIAFKDGHLGKGKFKWGANYYYAPSKSRLITDAQFITRKKGISYVKKGGKLAKDERITVDGRDYIANIYALIKTGVFKWNSVEYCADETGALMSEQFVVIDGVTKYADKDGAILYNTSFVVDGVTYKADANGAVKQTISVGQSIVNVAAKEVGTKTGKKYWDNVFSGAITYRDGDSTAWCGCFVTWCYRTAGQGSKINGCANPAYVPTIASWAKKNSTFKSKTVTAKPGDLILFDYNVNGTPDHVGLVKKVENGTVYTIEGNTGSTKQGEVKAKSYAKSYSGIYGYVRLV